MVGKVELNQVQNLVIRSRQERKEMNFGEPGESG
jgi:hypothetical protein